MQSKWKIEKENVLFFKADQTSHTSGLIAEMTVKVYAYLVDELVHEPIIEVTKAPSIFLTLGLHFSNIPKEERREEYLSRKFCFYGL
jgi:hypothetical protein